MSYAETYATALEKIEASELNVSQKRAAKRLLKDIHRAALTSIMGDKVSMELTLTTAGRFASFCCFADSKLYRATLTAVLGPRGGVTVGTKENRFADGGKCYF